MAIQARLLRNPPKGAVLIEVMIVAVIIAIVTTACLNLFNISRDIYLDSKGSFVATNALDSVMTYFENYYGSVIVPYAVSIPDPTGRPPTASFMMFADHSNQNYITNMPEGAGIGIILDQLQNWRIEYKVIEHQYTWRISGGYMSAPIRDVLSILRITWDGVRRDSAGRPIRKTEEIFSIFTLSNAIEW